MINIEDGEKKLKQADSFLTTLENIIKKHWWLLLLIGFGWFIYWAFNLPPVEEKAPIEQSVNANYEEDTTYYEEHTLVN